MPCQLKLSEKQETGSSKDVLWPSCFQFFYFFGYYFGGVYERVVFALLTESLSGLFDHSLQNLYFDSSEKAIIPLRVIFTSLDM